MHDIVCIFSSSSFFFHFCCFRREQKQKLANDATMATSAMYNSFFSRCKCIHIRSQQIKRCRESFMCDRVRVHRKIRFACPNKIDSWQYCVYGFSAVFFFFISCARPKIYRMNMPLMAIQILWFQSKAGKKYSHRPIRTKWRGVASTRSRVIICATRLYILLFIQFSRYFISYSNWVEATSNSFFFFFLR